MRLIKFFLLFVVLVTTASSSFALSVYTDSSYFPAIKNEIDQAHASINIWVNNIAIDNKPDDPVIILIDALEQSAMRGVAVNLNIPSGTIPSAIIKEMTATGIRVLRNEDQSPQSKLIIDDKTILGSHGWSRSNLSDTHSISFCFDPTDKYSFIPANKLERLIIKTMEQANGYINVALNNMDNVSPYFHLRLNNLLENKVINGKSVNVLLEQSVISPFSVQSWYAGKGKNIRAANDLYSKKVPVFLDPHDTAFNYELYIMDSTIIFGIEPAVQLKIRQGRTYFMVHSIDMALALRAYYDALPKMSVQDIVRYN